MRKKEQGVLTVEATIVLMVFVMFVLFLYNFAGVYRAQSTVSHAAIESADAVALESYLREVAFESDPQEVIYLASKLGGSSTLDASALESLRTADMPKLAKEKFIAAIAKNESEADNKLKQLGIKDGLSGISFSQCHADLDGDNIIVFLEYTVELQFPVFGAREIQVTKAAKAKTFGEILYAVSTSSNNPEWGNTSGDNRVDHGAYVEISATPNFGYRFVKWDDGNTDNPRRVLVTDVAKYKAIFEPTQMGINLYLKKTSSDTKYRWDEDQEYGTVTGSGNYTYMEPVTIAATAKEHYNFIGWDDDGNGTVDSTENPREIIVDETHNITAIYQAEKYTITVKSNNINYGSAKAFCGEKEGTSITVEYRSKVKLVASAEPTYRLKRWSNNVGETEQTVEVLGNATYTAEFERDICNVVFYNGSKKLHSTSVVRWSSIDGSKPYVGSSIYDGSKISGFSYWRSSNGSTFTSETEVSDSIEVYAVLNCTVTLNAAGGSVDWTSQIIERDSTILLPKPTLAGHTFKGWKASTGTIYNDSSYAFSSDITLTAQWSCDEKIGVLTGNMYQPYCREIYSEGKLKSGATLPWREYRCETCEHTWKSVDESLRLHYRMNDGSKEDDFNVRCNTKHSYTALRYCGQYSDGSVSGGEHTWDGYYHIMCQYCREEEQGVVYIKINGNWEYRHVLSCAEHADPGDVNCPF